MKGVPQRRVKASKLQRWWHQLSYELQSGRRTGVYFSLMIQRQWRGYRVRAFIIPKLKKRKKNYFLRSMYVFQFFSFFFQFFFIFNCSFTHILILFFQTF